MKKAILTLLVLGLCLCLCACKEKGRSEDITPPATRDTSGGDQEGAIDTHLLVQKACGEWYVGSVDSEDAPFQSLTIFEDGTCVVDGVQAKWQIEEYYTTEGFLSIYIFVNGEARYGVLYASRTGACTLTRPDLYPVFLPYEAYKKQ